ncbi:MAG: hypothetical protein QXK76_02170 [Candidatus Woesearchaeota archaeon]
MKEDVQIETILDIDVMLMQAQQHIQSNNTMHALAYIKEARNTLAEIQSQPNGFNRVYLLK